MVCIHHKARRFEISFSKTRRRQSADSCPYCGCDSLWAQSYSKWNWPTEIPCSYCHGEPTEEDATREPEGRRNP